MAGLLGANYSYTLKESRIVFSFPAEKLFHINGTPREDFRPTHLIKDLDEQLTTAIQLLRKNFKNTGTVYFGKQ